MKFCIQCGSELNDGAKFCTVCGHKADEEQTSEKVHESLDRSVVEAEEQSTPTATAQPPAPTEKKSNANVIGFFEKNFWILFIATGVCAYLLIQLGEIFSLLSLGFTVFIGILAIISCLMFLAVGIVRKIISAKHKGEKDTALRDNICLVISIITFVFVLIGAIGLFITAKEMGDITDSFTSIGDMFGSLGDLFK